MTKPGYGKQKGGEYERTICKELSLWVSNNKRDDIFWRSAMSGGRATFQRKKGINNKTQLGDITAIDSLGQNLTNLFIIECKYYQDLKLENLVYKTSVSGIISMWNTLINSCKINKKYPMLIAKQNFKPDLIFVNGYTERFLSKYYDNFYYEAYMPKYNLCVYTLNSFLQIVDYKIFEKVISE